MYRPTKHADDMLEESCQKELTMYIRPFWAEQKIFYEHISVLAYRHTVAR